MIIEEDKGDAPMTHSPPRASQASPSLSKEQLLVIAASKKAAEQRLAQSSTSPVPPVAAASSSRSVAVAIDTSSQLASPRARPPPFVLPYSAGAATLSLPVVPVASDAELEEAKDSADKVATASAAATMTLFESSPAAEHQEPGTAEMESTDGLPAAASTTQSLPARADDAMNLDQTGGTPALQQLPSEAPPTSVLEESSFDSQLTVSESPPAAKALQLADMSMLQAPHSGSSLVSGTSLSGSSSSLDLGGMQLQSDSPASPSSRCGSVSTARLPNPMFSPSPVPPSEPVNDKDIPSYVSGLMMYLRSLSDHTIRPRTSAWDHIGYCGNLTTEFAEEDMRFKRPAGVMWVDDDEARTARNDDSTLPSHQQDLPLLPYITFGVRGDGNCVMRSLMLSDVTSNSKRSSLESIRDELRKQSRDVVWMDCPDFKAELEVVKKYRNLLADHPTSPDLPPTSSLRQDVRKMGESPEAEKAATLASSLHMHDIHVACYDMQHPGWYWDRSIPRGVVQLPAEKVSKINHEKDQVSHPRTAVLQYIEGTRFLPQKGRGGTSLLGLGSPVSGHVEPMIPAPQMLLKSVSHPFFTMQPAAWFFLRGSQEIFATAYHHGWFNVQVTSMYFGKLGFASELRSPLIAASTNGPFQGAVFYGDVVSWRSGSADRQGVVVFTGVRMSRALGRNYLQQLCKSFEIPTPAAFSALPEVAPSPFVLVVELLPDGAPLSGPDSATCFQGLPSTSKVEITRVNTNDITRLWSARDHELGRLGEIELGNSKRPPLLHRTTPEAVPINLENPAQPTRLRVFIESRPVFQALCDWVVDQTSMVADKSGGELLDELFEAATAGFPITVLLDVRASINCALPLAQRGSAPAYCPRSGFFTPLLQEGLKTMAENQAATAAAAASGPSIQRSSDPSRVGRPQRTAAVKAIVALSKIDDERNSVRVPLRPTPRTSSGRTPLPLDKSDSLTPADADQEMSGPLPANPSLRSRNKSQVSPAASSNRAPKRKANTQSEQDMDMEEHLTNRSQRMAAFALYQLLGDVFAVECNAPFAAYVWACWTESEQYDAYMPKQDLKAALEPHIDAAFKSLGDDDEQLKEYLFAIVAEKFDSSPADVAKKFALSGWRKQYKKHSAPKTNGQLWLFCGGAAPLGKYGSVFDMYCSGKWYSNKKTAECYQPRASSADVVAAAAARSSSATAFPSPARKASGATAEPAAAKSGEAKVSVLPASSSQSGSNKRCMRSGGSSDLETPSSAAVASTQSGSRGSNKRSKLTPAAAAVVLSGSESSSISQPGHAISLAACPISPADSMAAVLQQQQVMFERQLDLNRQLQERQYRDALEARAASEANSLKMLQAVQGMNQNVNSVMMRVASALPMRSHETLRAPALSPGAYRSPSHSPSVAALMPGVEEQLRSSSGHYPAPTSFLGEAQHSMNPFMDQFASVLATNLARSLSSNFSGGNRGQASSASAPRHGGGGSGLDGGYGSSGLGFSHH